MALELAILGHLSEGDLHGYELRKRVAATLRQPELSDGALYPALGRLERSGCVVVAGKQVTQAPAATPTGSLSGELAALRSVISRGKARSRRTYQLTAKGYEAFMQSMHSQDSDDKSFFVRMYFASSLLPDDRIALLQSRRLVLGDRIAAEQLALSDTNTEVFRRSLDERAIERLAADIAWIDRLLDSEEIRTPQRVPAIGLSTPATSVAAPTTEDYRR